MTPTEPTVPAGNAGPMGNTGPTGITRRASLMAAAAGAAALPLSLAVGTGPAAAQTAQASAPEAPMAPYYRFPLGKFEVTVLLAGFRPLENPQGTFGTNATPEEFAALSSDYFLPTDASINFFQPVVVRTPDALILFDTGLAPDGILGALQAAGIAASEITHVVLTHMHGDHIGGLSGPDGQTFPQAQVIAGRVEFDHWATAGNEGFDAKVKPLEANITFLADGDSVAPGITGELAPGHTPGHMIFHLESDGARLVLTADTANHFVWSLGKPDWEVRFDADKATAAATRKRVFGKIAEDRVAFIGYHMPFPAVGFVAVEGDGFRFVPASYQTLLGLG